MRRTDEGRQWSTDDGGRPILHGFEATRLCPTIYIYESLCWIQCYREDFCLMFVSYIYIYIYIYIYTCIFEKTVYFILLSINYFARIIFLCLHNHCYNLNREGRNCWFCWLFTCDSTFCSFRVSTLPLDARGCLRSLIEPAHEIMVLIT